MYTEEKSENLKEGFPINFFEANWLLGGRIYFPVSKSSGFACEYSHREKSGFRQKRSFLIARINAFFRPTVH